MLLLPLTRALIPALALLSLTLSGCTDEAAPSLHTLPSFHAFLGEEGQTGYEITLHGPVTIQDVHGNARKAYALDERIVNALAAPKTYYLDGALRVVAKDEHCDTLIDRCSDYLRRTYLAGELPPHGVGLLALAQKGPLLDYRSDPPTIIPHKQTRQGEKTVLELDYTATQNSWFHSNGKISYLYESTPWIASGQFQVRAFTPGEPLTPIPNWPTDILRPQSQEKSGLAFPDEDDDPFRLGATHLEFMQAARNHYANQTGDTNTCVVRYKASIARQAQSDALLAAKPSQTTEVILLTKRGTAAFNVELSYDIWGARQFSVTPTSGPPTTLSCEDIAHPAWPTLGMNDAIHRAEALGYGTTHSIIFQASTARHFTARPIEEGWTQYTVRMVPPFVNLDGFTSFTLYHATLDPFRGTWDELYANPAQIQ